VCLAAGALAATHNIWLRWLGESLTHSEPPCKADMVVVLAGDWWGNRVLKAGELLRAGWAPKVLVSGAGALYGVNEGDLAIQYAIRAGFPADGFFNLPSPGRSTEEEARFIVPELRRRNVHRFILVTSDFHTRRAACIYHKAAPDLPFCVVASVDPDFTPDGWWHTREGRKTAFFEWCKTIAYVFGI
jgi:uncharacterized SAM-binding protein YcdF (DUF218 family)